MRVCLKCKSRNYFNNFRYDTRIFKRIYTYCGWYHGSRTLWKRGRCFYFEVKFDHFRGGNRNRKTRSSSCLRAGPYKSCSSVPNNRNLETMPTFHNSMTRRSHLGLPLPAVEGFSLSSAFENPAGNIPRRIKESDNFAEYLSTGTVSILLEQKRKIVNKHSDVFFSFYFHYL